MKYWSKWRIYITEDLVCTTLVKARTAIGKGSLNKPTWNKPEFKKEINNMFYFYVLLYRAKTWTRQTETFEMRYSIE